MNTENQLRLRQAKKKIFFDQPNRGKPEDKHLKDNNIKVAQSELGKSMSAAEELKKHVQQLEANNNELKRLLRQERQRYDRLFDQYQQLAEKNSLIEKQYINLKYQHNKEIKELKRAISGIITQKVDKAFQQLELSLKEEKVSVSLRTKLQRFVQKMKELAKVTEKYRIKKTNSKKNQLYEFVEEKSKSYTSEKLLAQEKKIETFEFQEEILVQKEPKVTKSPQKQKQLSSIKSQSQISSRQPIVFEDEYYGQIQDFSQYEQKIIQRRNYELMKKNNRSSNEIKRKKIFEQV